MRRLIRVFPDAAALAQGAAAAFADAAAASAGPFRAALSGGATPRPLYELLAREPLRARVPWDRLDFWFGDERCVPTDSPDSNFRMASAALLGRIPLSSSQVHRVLTELSPEEAARRYAADLGQTRLDWAFLGLGPDGHTASLFPGTPAVTESSRRAVSVWVPEKRSHRVTLTLPVLNAAAAVAFVVSGADKADMVRRVLEGPADPALPASLVRPERGDLLWFLDRAAASRLTPDRRA